MYPPPHRTHTHTIPLIHSHNPICILLLIGHTHMYPPPHRTHTHTIPLVHSHNPTRAFARALIPPTQDLPALPPPLRKKSEIQDTYFKYILFPKLRGGGIREPEHKRPRAHMYPPPHRTLTHTLGEPEHKRLRAQIHTLMQLTLTQDVHAQDAHMRASMPT
jgi:hypothetical protein